MTGRAWSIEIANPMPSALPAMAVFSHDFAVGVNEWPAGVARVDSGVGLDETGKPTS